MLAALHLMPYAPRIILQLELAEWQDFNMMFDTTK